MNLLTYNENLFCGWFTALQNLIIQKSDKGNSVAIDDWHDYINKIENVFAEVLLKKSLINNMISLRIVWM